MADLLIGYLQNVALHVLEHTDSQVDVHRAAVQEPLPLPMFANNWETHASKCTTDQDFKLLVSHAEVHRPSCNPMYLGTTKFYVPAQTNAKVHDVLQMHMPMHTNAMSVCSCSCLSTTFSI
jgi:hypothetical protein